MTADHTPERLSAEDLERRQIGRSTGVRFFTQAAAESILAAHLADVEARLAAVEALADKLERRAEMYGVDDDNEGNVGMSAAYSVAVSEMRRALHPDPSEPA